MAKVFLEAGDTSFTAANNNTEVFGLDGTQTVVIAAGVTDVTVDQNIGGIKLAGNAGDYKFASNGADLIIYAADGTTVVAKVPVQMDADGTQLTFGSAAPVSVTIITSGDDAGKVQIGEQAVADAGAGEAPAPIEPGEGGEGGEGGEPTEPTEPVLDTYKLAAAKLDVNEGEANTFTVTAIGTDGQPFAVTADTTVTLKVIPGSTTAADQGTETTNLNDFGAGAFNLVTKTIAAGQSSVSFDVTTLADSLTELTETYQVEVKVGEQVFTKTINVLDGAIGAGQTYTLTTSPDNVVGTAGNDTINGYIGVAATATTLTAADVIDGGAGTDSLKLTVEGTGIAAGAGALPNASISNVEQFFIRDVATAASAYNFGSINGETQVWADTATNVGGVTFEDLGTGATVGIKGNNVLTNLANVSFSMATATDAVSIAIDGGVKNAAAPTITNVASGPAAAGAAGAATAATISSTGAANTVGAITLTSGAASTVKTLTINAATDLTAALVATDFAADATMVVTGAGKVNVGAGFDGATIDASANTGGLTVSTTNTVTKSVTGSSAADAVTLVGSLTSTGKIDLGAGNDKLLAGAGAAIAGTNVIDGGAGTDSISASLINAANAAAIKNFELLDITAATTGAGLDVELITGSTITGLTLSGNVAAGVATVNNVAAGVGLTVDGANTGLKTVNLKGASTNAADSFAVTFDGAKVAGAAAAVPNVTIATGLHLDYVESVSVASGGADNTWNGLLLDGGANNTLQTLTITGAKNLNLTTTATAFGKAPTNAADTTNGLKLIDGSAATGKLVINLTGATLNTSTSGLTVKGGSADDTITLVNSVPVAGSNSQKFVVDAGAGNDTIIVAANGGTLTGGAGDDTFNVTAAVATGVTEATSVLTTITDLAAGDKIDFSANATGTFQTTKVTLGAGVTNLDQALAAAVTTANNVSWFQYGSNTYIVADTDAAVGSGTFNAGDTVVKLTGLVDLSAASLAGTVLTIA